MGCLHASLTALRSFISFRKRHKLMGLLSTENVVDRKKIGLVRRLENVKLLSFSTPSKQSFLIV